NPGGTVAACLGPDGRTLHLLDVATGRTPGAIEGTVHVQSTVFSPDGRYLLSVGSDRTARVHEAGGGAPPGAVAVRRGPYEGAALTRDGRTVLLSMRPTSGEVTGYAVGVGKTWEIPSMGGGSINSLACSPDGRVIACGDFAGNLYLYDAGSRKLLASR